MGSYASGLADIAGAAGDVYSMFRKAPDRPLDPSQYGFRGLISTPGYNFGGGVLTRRQGPNDARTGLQNVTGDIRNLRSQVQPGFGRLTDAGVQAIRQKAAEAAGNLRANLARRGLAGASFASDLQNRLDLEYSQLENQFRTQAFQDEMAASQSFLDQELNAIGAQLAQDFGELGLSAQFLSGVKQAAVTQKEIAAQLAEENLMNKYQQQPVGSQRVTGPTSPTPKPGAGQMPRPMAPQAPAPVRQIPWGGMR